MMHRYTDKRHLWECPELVSTSQYIFLLICIWHRVADGNRTLYVLCILPFFKKSPFISIKSLETVQ